MYENFDDLIDKMIIPEINEEDFLRLLLTSEIAPLEGKFLLTQNFNYNLNPQGNSNTNLYIENIRLKAKVYLNSIKRLSKEKYQAINPAFISFMEFLSTINKEQYWNYVTTKRDNNIDNNNKKKMKMKYYENIVGDNKGIDFDPSSYSWYYYRSYTISPSLEESFHTKDVKHRLYISINYDQLMNFTTDFINELEKRQIPYLFKIKTSKPSGKCVDNDTIVIYADNEQRVTDYVNIIKNIIANNETYQQSIHKPSAHLGIISNTIGYGREFGPDTSYSSIVGELGLKAIFESLKDVPIGICQSQKFTRKEMLAIMEQMKYSLSYKDIFDNFKDKFWEEFYKLLQQKGYDPEYSVCFGPRECDILEQSTFGK